MKSQIRLTVALVFVLGVCLLTGCSKGKITADNYSKIKQGMSLSQVRDILGSEGKQTGTVITMPNGAQIDGAQVGGVVYTWQENGKSVSVMFIGGEVVTATFKGL